MTMTEQLRHDRYVFTTPSGFQLDPECSKLDPDESGTTEPIEGVLPSLSLTFVQKVSDKPENEIPHVDGELLAESLDLEKFSPTISLLTLPSRFNPNPLVYLQQGNMELEKSMPDFKADFCRKTMIGNYIAAYSQGALDTNFMLYRLVFAWIVADDLLAAEMSSIEKNIEKSWVTLHSFVNSVTLLQS